MAAVHVKIFYLQVFSDALEENLPVLDEMFAVFHVIERNSDSLG